jgi:hypothetical protein
MKNDLNICALEIYADCLKHKIDISIDWVPREENEIADALSKTEDFDDWSIQDRIFNYLQKTYGRFTIDIFASNLSNKVDKFYSKYWCLGSLGVDAFAYNWEKEFCWLLPPPKLIPRTLKHMKRCKAIGILTIPRWMSAAYWPLIHNGTVWAEGVHLLVEYKNPCNFFKKGPYGNNVFSENRFDSNVLVLKVDFSQKW